MNIKARALTVLAAVLIVLSGCDGRDQASRAGVSAAPNATDANVPHKPRHRENDHKVVVLVGPDFADKPDAVSGLIEEYGLDGSGGMTVLLRYPDSLMDGKTLKLSRLSEAVAAPGVTTLVTLGAPEGVVRELARIRDGAPNVRVANLFTQDDMLPVEAASDLTLEYSTPANPLADEKATAVPETDIDVLLLASVLAVEAKDQSVAPLDRFLAALDSARNYLKKKNAGAGWKVSAWLDPDTNIRSRVRLVLSSEGGAPK